MENRRYLTREELVDTLALAMENQRAEGYNLTPEEVATVTQSLVAEHLPRWSWNPTWDVLAAIAVALNRPDILAFGRSFEMFAMGVVMQAGDDPGAAWMRVEEAIAGGRRLFVQGLLDLLDHGGPGQRTR